MQKSISIRVTGRVQGVYYRQSCREEAEKLGITGHVKNEPDGSVSIIASGSSAQLEDFISRCRKGPSRAEVHDVEVREQAPFHSDHFVILR